MGNLAFRKAQDGYFFRIPSSPLPGPSRPSELIVGVPFTCFAVLLPCCILAPSLVIFLWGWCCSVSCEFFSRRESVAPLWVVFPCACANTD